MLLRFACRNHRSIRDRQELSFVATAYKERSESLIEVPGLTVKLLPSLAIYGANASGKTNLINAFSFFRAAILGSHSQRDEESGVPRAPFLLCDQPEEHDSEFECDFLIDGVRHHYGFRCNSRVILEEWLQAVPEGRTQLLFHRERGKPIKFGGNFRGPKKLTEQATSAAELFLSAADRNNHEQASKIAGEFRRIRKYGEFRESPHYQLCRNIADSAMKQRLLSLLKQADLGIRDVTVVQERFDIEAVPELMREIVKEFRAKSNLSPETEPSVRFLHGSSVGDREISFNNESHGTITLALMGAPLLTALDRGQTLFIDEISRNLHPLLSRHLVALFNNKATNPKGAQLVFTTHDTNHLTTDLLRRDQIWFTEKDQTGATHLYPLSDFKTRNTDNIEMGYLEGRFGAIPFLGLGRELFTEKHG